MTVFKSIDMDFIGKPAINPIIFYSGKFLGYFTWIVLFLLIMNFDVIDCFKVLNNNYISYIFLAEGVFFVFFSLINLGRSTRFGLPTDKTVLKTNGLYQISRNPMYLGFDFLTISAMIYTLNFWVIIPGIYSMLVYHLIILSEEKFLKERFGLEYLTYSQYSRRYF